MTMYPTIDIAILKGCADFKNKKIALKDLKNLLHDSAQQILSLEDRRVRDLLIQAENELDSIQFTKQEDEIFPSCVSVIARVEKAVV